MPAKKKAKKSKSAAAPGTIRLKVLTYNVMMLPGLIGKGNADIRRAGKIVKAIRQRDYDVVCLQEVFDEDVRRVFAKGLSKRFPHQVQKSHGGGIFEENSGLFMASRFPITSGGDGWSFEEFEACAGTDCLSEKGIQAVHLRLTESKPRVFLVLFNVHLQSDMEWTGENEATRNEQLVQMREFIGHSLTGIRRKRLPRTGGLLVGDFNIEGDQLEWERMFRKLEYPRDLYRMNSKKKGYTWDHLTNVNMIPQSDQDRLRLDYIFALDRVPVDSSFQKNSLRPIACESAEVQLFGTGPKSRLSDHYAVEAVITL